MQESPANVFFGRQLKAHLPVFWHHQYQNISYSDTCTDEYSANSEVPSQYGEGQNIWVKLDANKKWMPGKITQVLPNQSYIVSYQMDMNSEGMNTTSHDDQVPNQKLCLNQLICLMNNLGPTTSDLGKISSVKWPGLFPTTSVQEFSLPSGYHDNDFNWCLTTLSDLYSIHVLFCFFANLTLIQIIRVWLIQPAS